METVLKFDSVVLVKELNDKFRKVGEVFEIANILENSFLLRDSFKRVAIGVVSFEDFEKCFVPVANFKGWTDWMPITGFDGQTDAYYRTNRRKVQVKFLTGKIKAESCCSKEDEFNLTFGLQVAYLRCLNKALEQKRSKYEEELKTVHHDICENEHILKKMINSLGE